MLHISGDGLGSLITKDSYRDFHAIVEFKWGGKAWGNRADRARDAGLLVHCWGPDGGYSDKWVRLKLGPISLYIPNTAARVRAVRIHPRKS